MGKGTQLESNTVSDKKLVKKYMKCTKDLKKIKSKEIKLTKLVKRAKDIATHTKNKIKDINKKHDEEINTLKKSVASWKTKANDYLTAIDKQKQEIEGVLNTGSSELKSLESSMNDKLSTLQKKFNKKALSNSLKKERKEAKVVKAQFEKDITTLKKG